MPFDVNTILTSRKPFQLIIETVSLRESLSGVANDAFLKGKRKLSVFFKDFLKFKLTDKILQVTLSF